MVMILDFHGITKFPSGELITPATLNAWLLSQPDGYIGDGLLNWLAVTRLSQQINQVFETPKLEFSIIRDNLLTKATSELVEFLRPVIINIPGHFLVAEGITQVENPDFYIQDPAFSYTLLSEHEKEPLSLRTFTPSFTDLSYFLIHSPATIVPTLALQKEDEPLQLDLQTEASTLTAITTTEAGTATFSTSSSPAQTLLYLQKPDSGTYILSFSGPIGSTYSLELFLYTADGTAQIETLTGIFGPRSEQYQLTFLKAAGPQLLKQLFNSDDLSSDLSYFLENKSITSHFIWYELTRLLSLFETFPKQTQELKNHFLTLLAEHATDFESDTLTYLQAKIKLL